MSTAHVMRGTATLLAAGATCYTAPALFSIATAGTVFAACYSVGAKQTAMLHKKYMLANPEDFSGAPGFYVTVNTVASAAIAILASNPYLSAGAVLWSGCLLGENAVTTYHEWNHPGEKAAPSLNTTWNHLVLKFKQLAPDNGLQRKICLIAINAFAIYPQILAAPYIFGGASLAFIALWQSGNLPSNIKDLTNQRLEYLTIANLALSAIALYSQDYSILAIGAQGFSSVGCALLLI